MVNTQANVGLDVTLEVGALEETITVTADSPLIETTNASTGGVVDRRRSSRFRPPAAACS